MAYCRTRTHTFARQKFRFRTSWTCRYALTGRTGKQMRLLDASVDGGSKTDASHDEKLSQVNTEHDPRLGISDAFQRSTPYLCESALKCRRRPSYCRGLGPVDGPISHPKAGGMLRGRISEESSAQLRVGFLHGFRPVDSAQACSLHRSCCPVQILIGVQWSTDAAAPRHRDPLAHSLTTTRGLRILRAYRCLIVSPCPSLYDEAPSAAVRLKCGSQSVYLVSRIPCGGHLVNAEHDMISFFNLTAVISCRLVFDIDTCPLTCIRNTQPGLLNPVATGTVRKGGRTACCQCRHHQVVMITGIAYSIRTHSLLGQSKADPSRFIRECLTHWQLPSP